MKILKNNICIDTYIQSFQGYLDQKGNADGSENTANKNQKMYYHVLGTEQCKDIMVAEFPDNPDYLVYVPIHLLIILFCIHERKLYLWCWKKLIIKLQRLLTSSSKFHHFF